MTGFKQENCTHVVELKQALAMSVLQQENENSIFFIWHGDSGIFQVNSAFARVFGNKPKSFIEFKKCVFSEDLEKLDCLVNEKLDQHNMTIPLRLQVEGGEYTRFAMCFAQVGDSISGTLETLNSSDKLQKKLNDIAHERRQFALEAADAGLCDWDTRTNEIYYDQNYASMLGYEASDFTSTLAAWAESVHPEDYERTVELQLKYIAGPEFGDFFTSKFRFRAVNDEYLWLKGQDKVLSRDANGKAERIVGLHIDITKEEEIKTQLEFMATHDALTGLYNRAYFEQQISEYGSDILPAAYIVVDADGLKMINDCVNHATGDLMLQKLAHTLRFSLRGSDMLARIGGDEFAIYLPRTEKHNAIKVATKINDEIEASNRVGKNILVLASVGLAYATTNEELSTLAVRADEAMLEQKEIQRPESLKKIQVWINSFLGRGVTTYRDKRGN